MKKNVVKDILEGKQSVREILLVEGYTHYWKHKGFTDDQWTKMKAEAERVIMAAEDAGIELANGMGEEGTVPTVSDTEIILNGVGEESHETLHITKAAQDFDFTKTARKAYDPVVTTLLAYARDINPNFEPSSDGDEEDESAIKKEL